MVSDDLHITRYKGIITRTGLLMLVTGILVLIGWKFDIEILKNIYGQFPTMKVNTALNLIFLSIGYISLVILPKEIHKTVCVIAITPILILSGISLSQDIFTINLGIDNLFAFSQNNSGTILQGRMSATAAVCYILASLWVIITSNEIKSLVKFGQYILHTITVISISIFFGYLYGQLNLINLGVGAPMAIHASVSLILFSVTATLFNPKVGFAKAFTGTKIGNIMARKIITRILVVIVAVGYCEVLILSNKILFAELCSTILTLLLVVIALVGIKDFSVMLNAMEAEKENAFQNLSMGLEAAPYALITTDSNGLIQRVNKQTEALYGYDRTELIGKPVAILQPEKADIFNTDQRGLFFKQGKSIRLGTDSDQIVFTKNGGSFPAELTFTPFTSATGPNILISVVDLTECREKQRIIDMQITELSQKNAELQQYSYICSHDLQEPLRTVSNYVTVITEDYAEYITPEVSNHLTSINGAVHRMSKLIRHVLNYGKIGRNSTLVPIDCQSLLSDVSDDLSHLIQTTSAKITYETPLPIINGYETELRQLFQNLINNAIKFKRKDTPPNIRIGCLQQDNFFEFYVTDNGIGIDPKHHNNIFNIFQRLHSSDRYEGHGIGLANCKKIAELHGGTIWVESATNKGSTFKFRISHAGEFSLMLKEPA